MAKNRPSRDGDKNRFTSKGASRGGKGGSAHGGGTARFRPAKADRISPNRRGGFAGGERPYDYSRYEEEEATPEYMSRLFQKHSFPIDDKQLRRFWLYYDLLRQCNASLDLTRIMGIEATVLKHFIDSAIILRWFTPRGPVLDIGSGPGFPGVPMAIMRPDLRFVLAESRGKRVGFLEQVVAALGLKNVDLFPRSIREDSPLGEDHGKPIGDVVTRALETIPPTLERILPFFPAGGQVAFMKGPGCDEEIAAAQKNFAGVYELADDVAYSLPGTDQQRRLVLFRKLPPI
jgi:16S rRNA (guanine527-N7)-methyltransferase